jgi:Redoxin
LLWSRLELLEAGVPGAIEGLIGSARDLQVGDELPDVQLVDVTEEGPKKVSLRELFKGKKGVLVGVPGTCGLLSSFVQPVVQFRGWGYRKTCDMLHAPPYFLPFPLPRCVHARVPQDAPARLCPGL